MATREFSVRTKPWRYRFQTRASDAPPSAVEEERFETNLASHRKLHPDLQHTDLELQIWAPWARPHYGSLGFPTRSVTERAGEGGILAKDGSCPKLPEWPQNVVVVDASVARLPTRHTAAIMAHYFHLALTSEMRSQIYIRLSKYLAKTRPGRPTATNDFGQDAFKRDLDRARWTIKALLYL